MEPRRRCWRQWCRGRWRGDGQAVQGDAQHVVVAARARPAEAQVQNHPPRHPAQVGRPQLVLSHEASEDRGIAQGDDVHGLLKVHSSENDARSLGDPERRLGTPMRLFADHGPERRTQERGERTQGSLAQEDPRAEREDRQGDPPDDAT